MIQTVVTGASGLLGYQLLQTFREQSHEVLAVFNQNPELVISDVNKIQCDISDEKATISLKKYIKPSSLIVHCAAITNVDLCEKNKKLCKAVNIDGTKNICELARQTNSKLIYISTPSVFDGKTGNYKELDKTNPINYYNLSKVQGENHVLDYEKGLVIRTIPLGLHPMGRKPASFLEWLVSSFKNNLSINLFTDAMINPLTITTLSAMIASVAPFLDKGVIHLGSRDVVSKAAVGLEVKKFFPSYSGNLNLINMDNDSQIAERPKEMWLNVDKALSLGLNLPEALSDINQYLNGSKLL
ncbi:MAG: SDR family oxidoreductase [bacterium]|nr:SDR family oxidoreductase [bacterium]